MILYEDVNVLLKEEEGPCLGEGGELCQLIEENGVL